MKLNELRQIIRDEAKKTLNENIIVDILIKSMAWAGGAVVSTFLAEFIDRVINGAIRTYQDIKNIVAPEPYIKFLKRLEKNDAFNKQFIEFVIQNKKGDNLVGYRWIEKMTTLPAFVEEFDKFATKEGIDGIDKSELLSKISKLMWQTYLHNWEDIYAILKKKYPQFANELPEGKLNKTPMANLIQSKALAVMKLNELRQIIREEAKKALNEGSGRDLLHAIKPSEDLRYSVVELEKYLITIGDEKNIDWDWDQLAYLIVDIINDAKQEGYDELG